MTAAFPFRVKVPVFCSRRSNLPGPAISIGLWFIGRIFRCGRRPRVSDFHYLLVQPDGVPNNPSIFVSNEPSGHWKVGDMAIIRPGHELRILDVRRPDANGGPAAWAAEYQAVWTVEPAVAPNSSASERAFS